jgi:Zn-dependent peptidase ImmA (M78 family)
MERKILKREDIDRKCEEVIQYFDPSWLNLTVSPLSAVVNAIQREFKVPIHFNQDLGCTKDGRKILGSFTFKSREICIDPALVPDHPRFRWTLAHEVGHLILHRNIEPFKISRTRPQVVDTRKQLRLGGASPKSELEWIEWQANQFASSLLLPRPILMRSVIEEQQACDITTRPGTIFVDEQPENIHNFYRIIRAVSGRLTVSRTVLLIRLKNLGILVDQRAVAKSNIANVIRSLFTTE